MRIQSPCTPFYIHIEHRPPRTRPRRYIQLEVHPTDIEGALGPPLRLDAYRELVEEELAEAGAGIAAWG